MVDFWSDNRSSSPIASSLVDLACEDTKITYPVYKYLFRGQKKRDTLTGQEEEFLRPRHPCNR